MSKFLPVLFLGLLAGPWANCAVPTAPAKPNIIILLADDLGYADIGVQGSKDIPTPNIDSIARNGILFTNGYVSAPICTPSRAGLMSGQYQQRHADEELWGKPENRDGLSLTVTALPQRLKAAGYATGLIGKWHLGTDKAHHPLSRGFDEFYGFLNGGRGYHPMTPEGFAEFMSKPIKGDARIYRNWTVVPDPPYTTDAFGEEAVKFIERHKDGPFFLDWASQAPHEPTQPCERLMDKFAGIKDMKRREYASMVAAMDEAIGRILDTVKKEGLESKTLIFFLSDNGGPLTLSRNGSSNGPLRGEKVTTWEGGIHVPFLAQWKGTLPAGMVYTKPVIQLDITATALALAGLTPQPDWRLDGVNLMPYLLGQDTGWPHHTLFFRLGHNEGLREDNLKIVDSGETARTPNTSGLMLFDLSRDLGEKNNLGPQQPEKMKELQALFQKWGHEVDQQGEETKKAEARLPGAGQPDPIPPTPGAMGAPAAVTSATPPTGKAGAVNKKMTPAQERTAARQAARKAKNAGAAASPSPAQ